MILSTATILTFALAYGVKGGNLHAIFKNYGEVRERNYLLDRLLDGKVLSSIIVLAWATSVTLITQQNLTILPYEWLSPIAITCAWLLSVAPSMGEEYSAILNSKSKNPYQDHFTRSYGIKKAVQRGVWMGAIMALVTGYIGFIAASFAFVPLAWVALHYAPKKILIPWGWSEVLIGVVCFGVPFAFML